MGFYSKEQKQLLVDLINEANPDMQLHPATMDNVRLGNIYNRTPGPGEIADTSLEVYPDDGFFIGKQIVHYRRINVEKLFEHMVLQFDRWREDNMSASDLSDWINQRYGTTFNEGDFVGGASWSSWGGVRQTDISSNSLCYKGRLSFTWLKGERALDQIYETYDFDGRIWDERHGGPGDERPLLTLMGYGGDYSDLEGNILALSTGQVVDQNTGNMAVLVNRFNALYGTNLTLDKPHTEVNGLSGLSAVRVNLPSVSLPEANPETYSSALALNSKEDSWFGGRLIFHYGKKRKVPDSGVGPEVLTGTTAAGYFGLIEPGEFHDAESLSEALNFHVGNIYTSDPGWFKFMYQGKILLICKGHLRSHINWTHLYQAGLVYGGPGYGTYPEGGNIEQGKSIIYGGRSYKVRLIRGSDGDPYNGRGGEWNALLNSMMNGVWGNFSHQDLNVQGGTGGASWCMESGSNTGEALVRDGTYDAYLRDKNEGSYSQYRGWRPVLELMSE